MLTRAQLGGGGGGFPPATGALSPRGSRKAPGAIPGLGNIPPFSPRPGDLKAIDAGLAQALVDAAKRLEGGVPMAVHPVTEPSVIKMFAP